MYVLFAFIHSVSYSVSVYRGVQTARNGFIISGLGFSVFYFQRECPLVRVYRHIYTKTDIHLTPILALAELF